MGASLEPEKTMAASLPLRDPWILKVPFSKPHCCFIRAPVCDSRRARFPRSEILQAGHGVRTCGRWTRRRHGEQERLDRVRLYARSKQVVWVKGLSVALGQASEIGAGGDGMPNEEP